MRFAMFPHLYTIARIFQSAVDVNDLASDPPAQVGCEKRRRVANVVDRRVSAQRCDVRDISYRSVNPEMPRAESVIVGPGLTALTRIFCGPRSLARYRTEDSSAAFATPMTL